MKLLRCVELLAPALGDASGGPRWLVDGTLGLGGHAAALLRAAPDCRLLGIDRDPQALSIARQRLRFAGDRVVLVNAIFDELPRIMQEHGLPDAAALLLDLGVSSLQLDSPERGFTYAQDAPLDMRMDPSATRSAADVVNRYSGEELAGVFRDYGEERFASRIARDIVAARRVAPITTTGALVAIIAAAIPAPARRRGGNPAKRVFQALRIEVNDELGSLRRMLPVLLSALAVGGRAVVLSYHSLEDRMVKRAFAAATATQEPPDLPVITAQPRFRLLTRGAETADEAEVAANSRSASVRLRAITRQAP